MKKKTAVREATETSKDAPWQATPLWIARNRIRGDETYQLDTIFPEVMEEDRTSKLKDLATAQAVGSITHRRMSEQIAKELGFDDYDYDTELEEVKRELSELPQGILGVADAVAGAPPKPVGGSPAPPGGSLPAGPSGGIAGEDEGPLYPSRYTFGSGDDQGTGSRSPLSGKSTARFRRMQKDAGK